MSGPRHKVLLLTGRTPANSPLVQSLRAQADVVELATIDDAIEALRHQHFDAIFSDSADFLPLERALVSQQANLVLNTIGEGVCIVDGEGRCNWMNQKMQAWPAKVHERIRSTCRSAMELFRTQVSPRRADTPMFNRSKRYALTVDDQQFLEMIASPVINPAGEVVQVVVVAWDATSTRRLQQKIDAIDKAGGELVRLDAETIGRMNVAQRLKLLEDKIIRYTQELMHFDHFAIRLLDRGTNKLEPCIAVGFSPEALGVELFAAPENNGICGYVAATARSYICADVQRDPRYVPGLDQARSSLTVPLTLQDKVIGVLNVESHQTAAFTEDDRQFAEIFGRYVAIALNILDLMVGERVRASHKIADDVFGEVAGPLNDIVIDANALLDEYVEPEGLQRKLQQIVDNANRIRASLQQVTAGPNVVLGADKVKAEDDARLRGKRVLVADDDANIRQVIRGVLRKFAVHVTLATNGTEAIDLIEREGFDLILTDIKMPDRDGYDVFDAARRKAPGTPTILMTGFGYDPSHGVLRAQTAAGPQRVLFKPFRVEVLLAEVRQALQPTAA